MDVDNRIQCDVLLRLLADTFAYSDTVASFVTTIAEYIALVRFRVRLSGMKEPFWNPNDIDCILPNHLFLSDESAAVNSVLLEQHNIGLVVTIRQTRIADADRQPGIAYRFVQCHDEPTSRLDYFLHRAIEWIDAACKANVPALVHCHAGMSRSPAIVIGYLMLTKPMSLDDAVNNVQRIRPVVNLNPGFYKQLYRLDQFPLWIARHRRIYFAILAYLGLS